MKWTQLTRNDKDTLREMFADGRDDGAIAKKFGCDKDTVRHWRYRMGVRHRRGPKGHQWTDEELLFLKNYWREPDRWLAGKLNLSKQQVKLKRFEIDKTLSGTGNMTMKKKWKTAKDYRRKWKFTEELYLRDHYADRTAADLAAVLGYSPSAVKIKIHRLGLRK